MAKKEAKAAKPAKAEKPAKKAEETATDKMWRKLGQEWRLGASDAELRKAGCADPDKSMAEINARIGKGMDKKKEVLKFKDADGDGNRYMFKHYFDKYAPARFKGGKPKMAAGKVAAKVGKAKAAEVPLPEPKTGKAAKAKAGEDFMDGSSIDEPAEKPAAKGRQVDDGFDEPEAEDMDEKPEDPKADKAEGKDDFDF